MILLSISIDRYIFIYKETKKMKCQESEDDGVGVRIIRSMDLVRLLKILNISN
jgi:hypothetical protein